VPKIKIDRQLYEQIKECSEIAGYSSSDELIQHILKKEINRILDTDHDPDVLERLKGLGYIA
jgi:metal-responsive CopG/Arc/MetJ family transcriptional regulator